LNVFTHPLDWIALAAGPPKPASVDLVQWTPEDGHPGVGELFQIVGRDAYRRQTIRSRALPATWK